MKTKLWLLTMIALVVIVPLGGQGPKPLQPLNQIAVLDANGKRVGPIIDSFNTYSGGPTVAFKLDDRIMVLGVTPDSLVGNRDLIFTTTDCSGTPYFAYLE